MQNSKMIKPCQLDVYAYDMNILTIWLSHSYMWLKKVDYLNLRNIHILEEYWNVLLLWCKILKRENNLKRILQRKSLFFLFEYMWELVELQYENMSIRHTNSLADTVRIALSCWHVKVFNTEHDPNIT